MRYFNFFYLDKEKDIIVNLYKDDDEMTYILETPNHKSGNLITNLAKLTNHPISFNEAGLKVLKGSIPCYVTNGNESVYIFRLGGIKVANIYEDGFIEIKATIAAISKTLLSQTKESNLTLEETLVKTYILKPCKFKTDLHTHMNANLSADTLIALGIYHQLAYPYYYIKKLQLRITEKQRAGLEEQRLQVAEQFKDSQLQGKYLQRRIDDNTFINFADLILNNLENADYNIKKIRASLTILKDGQAVFTNLEKVYLYRYVFTKGQSSSEKIELKNIEQIPDQDIILTLRQMLSDSKNEKYKNNTLFQDKLLWIGRSYQKQGIKYAEIADTTLVKKKESVDELLQIHQIMPLIEEETGVQIRFLAAMRRIPLTIIKDAATPNNYLRENLDVLKAVALDPYVVGSDFVGEEINDILELKPVISEIVGIAKNDPYFTIRIHAGENDSLTDNVANALYCVSSSLADGQPFPKMRIGHGIYTAPLNTAKGKRLLNDLKENKVILEFQITSNVRLNNLSVLEDHPIKQYLEKGINCVQGSDGFGMYGVDSFDEQLALINLLHLSDEDLLKMRKVEDQVIEDAQKAFEFKQKNFEELTREKGIEAFLRQEIESNYQTGLALSLTLTHKHESNKVFVNQIEPLPLDKIPVIVAGGSFNSDKRHTRMSERGKEVIDDLLEKLDEEKYFIVIGHHLSGYEKYLLQKNKKFRVFAIVPALVTDEEAKRLQKAKVAIRVSTESLGMGIYKSFNYEIFERRESILVAMDGNSAGANLLQEAKNGKAHCQIYAFKESETIRRKAESLEGYVTLFD